MGWQPGRKREARNNYIYIHTHTYTRTYIYIYRERQCIETYRMGRDVEARWTIELRGAPSANLTPRQGRVSKGGNKKIHAGAQAVKEHQQVSC